MNDYRVSRWFYLVLLALAFAVVSTPAIAIEVKLEVNANKLEIVDNDRKCHGNQMDCIWPVKGNSPFIHFRLANACDGTGDDPKFKLNRMQLSMVKSTRGGKAFGVYELPNIVATDFKADAGTGWVEFGGRGPNSKKAGELTR